jgi:hypothetical protein
MRLRRSLLKSLPLAPYFTIIETAAWLSVAPSTVHRLPLPSIRLGKSLRFDPADVRRLIESSKEPAICSQHAEADGPGSKPGHIGRSAKKRVKTGGDRLRLKANCR